jgi:hypothetical protein
LNVGIGSYLKLKVILKKIEIRTIPLIKKSKLKLGSIFEIKKTKLNLEHSPN